jgi:hypothetical protein
MAKWVLDISFRPRGRVSGNAIRSEAPRRLAGSTTKNPAKSGDDINPEVLRPKTLNRKAGSCKKLAKR